MNKLKEKYYIALGNLQSMAIDNTKGSKGVDICVLDINEYVAYLQSKIDKAIEYYETHQQECVIGRNRDDKLIKDYYLPAQCSKKLYDILKEGK